MYWLLKLVITFTLHIFYRKVTVLRKRDLITEGPLLVAANHPNTLMDPLIVASLLPQRAGFMAKATFMKGALSRWFFKQFHIVPVYRQQDAETGKPVDNSASFKKCFQYLAKGGTLMIFPEGTSVAEMKLRKLKTGVARIALEFEAQHQFKAGLRIQPITLNYSDPATFRSQVMVHIATPIIVADYATEFKADPAQAVLLLTQHVSELMEERMITTNHKSQEETLNMLQVVYVDHLHNTLQLPTDSKTQFEVKKELGRALMHYEKHDPQRYQSIQNKLEHYFALLKQSNLHDDLMHKYPTTSSVTIKALWQIVIVIAGFPFYLAGLISNYIPYRLPAALSKKISNEVEYRSSLMMLIGMLVFPVWYGFLLYSLAAYSQLPAWSIILTAASFPFLGFFVLYYWNRIISLYNIFNYILLTKKKRDLPDRLKEIRTQLIQALENTRNEYMKAN